MPTNNRKPGTYPSVVRPLDSVSFKSVTKTDQKGVVTAKTTVNGVEYVGTGRSGRLANQNLRSKVYDDVLGNKIKTR